MEFETNALREEKPNNINRPMKDDNLLVIARVQLSMTQCFLGSSKKKQQDVNCNYYEEVDCLWTSNNVSQSTN